MERFDDERYGQEGDAEKIDDIQAVAGRRLNATNEFAQKFTIDMQKTDRIAEAVRASDIFFIEGLMFLHHPLMTRLVQLIQDTVVGEIRTVSGHYCADIAQFVNPQGGGALYNLGCYPISLLHLVMQTAFGNDIWSTFRLVGSGTLSPTDDNICEASMILSLPNGVSARMHTAKTYGLFSEFTIVGDQGTLQFRSNPWLPEKKNGIEVVPYSGEKQLIEVDAEGDACFYQIKRIREAIEQDRYQLARPAPRLQDSVEVMEILTRWEEACLKNFDSAAGS